MEQFLIEEFRRLGSDQKGAALACHVYLELSEVKKYRGLQYEYIPQLKRILIRAKKKASEDLSAFLPIPSYEQLSFLHLQQLLELSKEDNVFLAIVHPDSTCVYYEVSKGLKAPSDTTAKHLRVNRQEKLEEKLKRHRVLIEQAALLNLAVTVPKEAGRNEAEAGSSVT